MSFLPNLPPHFLTTPYNGTVIPQKGVGLESGANCQHFAYTVLRHFGYTVPDFRSSDLWDDTTHTNRVTGDLQPFDILLFNKTSDPYGAHVGLFCGDNKVLHLCRSVGIPAVWTMNDFLNKPEYCVYLGAKRLHHIVKDRE